MLNIPAGRDPCLVEVEVVRSESRGCSGGQGHGVVGRRGGLCLSQDLVDFLPKLEEGSTGPALHC